MEDFSNETCIGEKLQNDYIFFWKKVEETLSHLFKSRLAIDEAYLIFIAFSYSLIYMKLFHFTVFILVWNTLEFTYCENISYLSLPQQSWLVCATQLL